MKTNDHVLELLYDRGESFFLLDELAGASGLSTSRLGQVLDKLKDCGHRLEVSPAYGVRLIGPVKPNAHLLEQALAGRRIGRGVVCFDRVASTNDVAMASARQADADGLVVLAESQTSGRGRLGRRWLDEPGRNILMSVLLLDSASSPSRHEAFTIAAGLAVAEGIEAATGLRTSLKWPNDVLIEDKKVAGVLVETSTSADRRAVVIGMGINANTSPDDSEVDCAATSLAAHTGATIDRMNVVVAVLQKMDEHVGDIEAGRIETLHDPWMARCGMINKRITVRSAGVVHVGRVLDVSPMAGLVLCCDDGRQVHLPAKSSSVQPRGEP